jgi:hypothetical protein
MFRTLYFLKILEKDIIGIHKPHFTFVGLQQIIGNVRFISVLADDDKVAGNIRGKKPISCIEAGIREKGISIDRIIVDAFAEVRIFIFIKFTERRHGSEYCCDENFTQYGSKNYYFYYFYGLIHYQKCLS